MNGGIGFHKAKFICNICGNIIRANKNECLGNGFKYCPNCCKYVHAKKQKMGKL